MRNRKWYEWLLTLTFIAMAGLCAVLNLTAGQKEGPANLAVNVIMFLIIGVILLSCERNAFFPMNRIIGDLKHATEKIRSDAMNSRQFLWEPYNANKVELFQEPELKQRFQDYLFELNRIDNTEQAYYKCDIEDYVNAGLVDTVMHRNILNQVAGVMTGLGILGTFIGLSLGLQHFSTGTTAEVTNSIAPLMDGIKVAFHTSIYGMVFSLVFNFVYKCKLEEGENAVEAFLEAYKKYVLPDTTTDGINKLMELQQMQVAAIGNLTEQVAANMNRVMEPQFERLNQTITDFGNLATRTQTEAMTGVVNVFLEGMEASMGNTFTRLNALLKEAEAAQQSNGEALQEIRTQSDEGRQILYRSGEYLKEFEQYRQSLSEAAELIDAQMEKQQMLTDDLRRMVVQMNNTVSTSFKQAEQSLARNTETAEGIRKSTEGLRMTMEELRVTAENILESVETMQKSRARR